MLEFNFKNFNVSVIAAIYLQRVTGHTDMVIVENFSYHGRGIIIYIAYLQVFIINMIIIVIPDP